MVQLSRDTDEIDGPKNRHLRTYEEHRKQGLVLLNKLVEASRDCLRDVAKSMFKFLKDSSRLKTKLEEPHRSAPYAIKGPERKLFEVRNGVGGMRRERKEWSKEENEIFLKLADGNHSAKDIADALMIRTPQDVHDHNKWLNSKLREEGKQRRVLKREPRKHKHASESTD